ncbi:hypothetical protein AGDE_08711 [Angomonas deanei]|uniref:Uncharacterized protein n=1 Tax=Angomonas deanei TaxID=59799 RepID=A0A7G2C705_9TRYP|nr:hypothetical protein AGDE_08711 [Angomonas deanei]CAD2214821.1 hypothetical protein, conserved [Angomonas deanei]|eukprot:EPY32401.1 hypothetical protein AGDE_08711 [Angomonas deanei]
MNQPSFTGSKVIIGSDGGERNHSILSDDFFRFSPQCAQYGSHNLLVCAGHFGREENTIFVYDMNSFQLVQTLFGHEGTVTCLAWNDIPMSFLQNSCFLFSGTETGEMCLWDVTEGIVLSKVSTPNGLPVRSLLPLPSAHLLCAITEDGTNYLFDSLLGGPPLETDVLPLRPIDPRQWEPANADVKSLKGSLNLGKLKSNLSSPKFEKATWPVPFRVSLSKLSPNSTFAVVMNDRIRIITNSAIDKRTATSSNSGLPLSCRAVAKDLIYDSEDGAQTVMDAFFSEAHEDVLHFATRYTVGSYDWKLGSVLNEQLIWTNGVDEFRSIFPSSPPIDLENHDALTMPFMYSFGTDLRLTAWYMLRTGKFTSVSVDVRGFRIASKSVFHVVQSDLNPCLFSVLLENGGVASWQYNVYSQRFTMLGQVSSPLSRPICLTRVGMHSVCSALEGGQLVLIDTEHNNAQRRFNMVYSSGTRIILLCNHRFEDLVWVVSSKRHDGKYQHQVSLLDSRSGRVVKVLRKPSLNSEPCIMKSVSTDSSCTYLLLVYMNGTFEVWNTDDDRLVHLHSGLGVADVSWAPSELSRCVSGLQGNPQILCVVFSEGAMSLWSVYQDRVVISRDAVSLFPSSAAQGTTVVSTAVLNRMCLFDSLGNGVTVYGKNSKLSSRALSEPIPNAGHVVCLVAPAESSQLLGSFAVSSFTEDTALANPSRLPLVAAVFHDGSVGVWDVDTGARIAVSTVGALGGVKCVAATWIENMLALLTTRGSILLVDRFLQSVNSSVSAKSLRRPLLNTSFLLPAQRTFIQTSLELNTMQREAVLPNNSEMATSGTPSKFISSIPSERLPCRGPLGQLITKEIKSLEEEQRLYLSTMLPANIRAKVEEAHQARCVASVAFWVSVFLGRREKICFWWLVYHSLREEKKTGPPATSGSRVPLRIQRSLSEWEVIGEPYFMADAVSPGYGNETQIRRNLYILCEQRSVALQTNDNVNVDDSVGRLLVCRDYLKLQEAVKAVDILVNSNYQSAHFNMLSTLAVTIAAHANFDQSEEDSPAKELYTQTLKQTAAMLLAKGDVQGAVEKYVLARDINEAALAYQSQGRWEEAAHLLNCFPGVSPSVVQEVRQRWALHYEKQGFTLRSATVLLSLGQRHFGEVLTALNKGPPCGDVAGMFALLLATRWDSAKKGEGDTTVSEVDAHYATVVDALRNFSSILTSVGNHSGDTIVSSFLSPVQAV